VKNTPAMKRITVNNFLPKKHTKIPSKIKMIHIAILLFVNQPQNAFKDAVLQPAEE
jgi:hypothetical protein